MLDRSSVVARRAAAGRLAHLGADQKTVICKVTPEEHAKLAASCAATGTTQQDAVRKALRAVGLI